MDKEIASPTAQAIVPKRARWEKLTKQNRYLTKHKKSKKHLQPKITKSKAAKEIKRQHYYKGSVEIRWNNFVGPNGSPKKDITGINASITPSSDSEPSRMYCEYTLDSGHYTLILTPYDENGWTLFKQGFQRVQGGYLRGQAQEGKVTGRVEISDNRIYVGGAWEADDPTGYDTSSGYFDANLTERIMLRNR